MTIEATNAIHTIVAGFSQAIIIDDTPPTSGLVIELDGVHVINGTDPTLSDQPAVCTDDAGMCM